MLTLHQRLELKTDPSNPPRMPTMQVQQQQHKFDDNITDSTTLPWVLRQQQGSLKSRQ